MLTIFVACVRAMHDEFRTNLFSCSLQNPFPIVDIEQTRKDASNIVWNLRKNSRVKQEGKRIVKKHVNTKAVSSEIFNGKT